MPIGGTLLDTIPHLKVKPQVQHRMPMEMTMEVGADNGLAMYCHQIVSTHDLIQLHRQIMHQNDGLSMKNWLKSSPPAFFNSKQQNDMAAFCTFWACFCSNQRPSKISPTAENSTAAAIPVSSSFLEMTILVHTLKLQKFNYSCEGSLHLATCWTWPSSSIEIGRRTKQALYVRQCVASSVL